VGRVRDREGAQDRNPRWTQASREDGEFVRRPFQGLAAQTVVSDNCTDTVYTVSVKNITLSADQALIEQARLVARSQHKTLNAAFREWLEQYAAQAGGGAAVEALMRRLRHVSSAGPYTRDEMNER